MNDTLRTDEELVTTAIARDFSAAWKAGENPPDAYLLLPERTVALEVTRLEEVDLDEKHGGNRPSCANDMTAAIFSNELNKTLRQKLPDRIYVMLQLNDLITNPRKTRTELEQFIIQCVRDSPQGSPQHSIVINDNKIRVQIKCSAEAVSHAVVHMHGRAKVINNPISENAWIILEERLRMKAQKCKGLCGEIWLGLLNNYCADAETYRSVLGMFNVEHPFSKILLVSLDGVVETLW